MLSGLVDDILDIFSVAKEDKMDIKYQMWLDMFLGALRGLEMYQLKQVRGVGVVQYCL